MSVRLAGVNAFRGSESTKGVKSGPSSQAFSLLSKKWARFLLNLMPSSLVSRNQNATSFMTSAGQSATPHILDHRTESQFDSDRIGESPTGVQDGANR